ncbi:MAG: hypothetical protein R2728_03885 [Chitinophagales bacterium]
MKQALYQICQNFIDKKKTVLNQAFATITDGMDNETKSSVGDKFETTRAHLQIEQNNLHLQLNEVNTLETTLKSIDLDKKSAAVALGSLVFTTKSNYYIAIPIGKMQVNETVVYGISMASPIGKLLMGKHVGDQFTFNGKTSEITEIH